MKRYIKSAVRSIIDEPNAIKGDIIRSNRTPYAMLMQLANDPDSSVRMDLACSLTTPPEILDKLSTDPDVYVRREVAINSNTPVETLLRMAKEEDDDRVRATMANRLYKYPSKVVLAILSNDTEKDHVLGEALRQLRYGMLKPSVRVCKLLAGCSNDYIRQCLAREWQDIGIPEQVIPVFMRSEDVATRYCVVSYKTYLPLNVIDMALDDPAPQVRYAVARDVILPDGYYEKFLNDPEPDVRAGLARNPSTPKDILIQLSTDKDEDVRTWANRRLSQ